MAKIAFEHMEESLSLWATEGTSIYIMHTVEYKAATKHIGAHNVIFTNFPFHEFASSLGVQAFDQKISELFSLDRVCLLDSEAEHTLSPADSENFDYFLIGGILGNGTSIYIILLVDEFDADRTRFLREKGFSRRKMGNMQMTMDTAAIVCSKIVNEKINFWEIKFVDRPTIHINKFERVKMNFRYLLDEKTNKPVISEQVLQIIKNTDDFALESLE